MDFETPKACKLAHDQIELVAQKVREATGYELDGNLEDVVKKLGGTIQYYSASESEQFVHGSIQVRGKKDFSIFLPSFTGRLRDRFTIAHELGHYFLHSLQGKLAIQAERAGTGPIEQEANTFAAGLLMPEQRMRDLYKEFKGQYLPISSRLGVSPRAIQVRLKILELEE